MELIWHDKNTTLRPQEGPKKSQRLVNFYNLILICLLFGKVHVKQCFHIMPKKSTY